MNFNLYLRDEAARQLASLAKRRGTSRNALIRDAVSEWLGREGRPSWPERVLSFRGVPGFKPFEAHRDELAAEMSDPFAAE